MQTTLNEDPFMEGFSGFLILIVTGVGIAFPFLMDWSGHWASLTGPLALGLGVILIDRLQKGIAGGSTLALAIFGLLATPRVCLPRPSQFVNAHATQPDCSKKLGE
jgi:hypothetical protein